MFLKEETRLESNKAEKTIAQVKNHFFVSHNTVTDVSRFLHSKSLGLLLNMPPLGIRRIYDRQNNSTLLLALAGRYASFERDGFKAMMADVEAGKVSTVITKDLSRFGRDYLKTGEYIEIIFPDYDVR